MIKQERVQATIPANYKWHNEDIDKRAKEFGLKKGDFILFAVDFMLNIDDTAWGIISNYSKGLKVPEYLIIQNILIKRAADQAAQMETYGRILDGVLDEFISNSQDGINWKMLTGEELFNVLKDKYVREYKKEIKEAEEELNSYK